MSDAVSDEVSGTRHTRNPIPSGLCSRAWDSMEELYLLRYEYSLAHANCSTLLQATAIGRV